MRIFIVMLYGMVILGFHSISFANQIEFNEAFFPDNKLAVWDKLNPTVTVQLLYKDSTICSTKTLGHGFFDHPYEPYDVTYLKQGDCKSKKILISVITKKKIEYQYIKLQEVENKQILDKTISKALTLEHPKCPDYLKIEKKQGTVWKIGNSKYLIQLKRVSNSKGPLFLSLNNSIKELEGGCAYRIHVFKIDQIFYLKYIQGGCDGGVSIARIIEFNDKDIKQVYYNSRWST